MKFKNLFLLFIYFSDIGDLKIEVCIKIEGKSLCFKNNLE